MTHLWQQHQGILLDDEKYSDLTIKCGTREFKAHRAIICPQSPFFEKACSSHFKEATTRIIELPEDDPEVLYSFLQALYYRDYDDHGVYVGERPKLIATYSDDPDNLGEYIFKNVPDIGTVAIQRPSNHWGLDTVSEDGTLSNPYRQTSNHTPSLFHNLRIYIMAEKYQVPSLESLAMVRLIKGFGQHMETAGDLATFVAEVYRTLPPHKHFVATNLCDDIYSRYKRDVQFHKEMRTVMEEFPDFALDMLNVIERNSDDFLRNPSFSSI